MDRVLQKRRDSFQAAEAWTARMKVMCKWFSDQKKRKQITPQSVITPISCSELHGEITEWFRDWPDRFLSDKVKLCACQICKAHFLRAAMTRRELGQLPKALKWLPQSSCERLKTKLCLDLDVMLFYFLSLSSCHTLCTSTAKSCGVAQQNILYIDECHDSTSPKYIVVRLVFPQLHAKYGDKFEHFSSFLLSLHRQSFACVTQFSFSQHIELGPQQERFSYNNRGPWAGGASLSWFTRSVKVRGNLSQKERLVFPFVPSLELTVDQVKNATIGQKKCLRTQYTCASKIHSSRKCPESATKWSTFQVQFPLSLPWHRYTHGVRTTQVHAWIQEHTSTRMELGPHKYTHGVKNTQVHAWS